MIPPCFNQFLVNYTILKIQYPQITIKNETLYFLKDFLYFPYALP